MNLETCHPETRQPACPRTQEPPVYGPPRLVELGSLEQVQGNIGYYRDFGSSGRYEVAD